MKNGKEIGMKGKEGKRGGGKKRLNKGKREKRSGNRGGKGK